MAARKNKPPFATLAALAALVVIVFAITTPSAATTIAPAKDRMANVVIGGKTIIAEVIPVFATTEWTHINKDNTTTTARIAQTIPITTKPITIGDKTTTIKIQNNQRREVAFGTKTITVEIAADSASRIKGLSARQTLSGGMLFVYNKPKTICLWMKNTYISLEALFLHEDGKIINTSQMKPHTTNTHCSTTKAKYALELPAQWRKENKVQDATKVILPKNLSNDNDD